MTSDMLMLILIPVVLGLVVWAVRTKQYAPACMALGVLFATVSFVFGIFAFDHNRSWSGIVMVALSIAALVSAAALAMRFQSSAPEHRKQTALPDRSRPQP